MNKLASLFSPLMKTVDQLTSEFELIPEDRKKLLKELTDFVEEKFKTHEEISLNFICTHNSRRSHIAQIWAQTAAHYFNISNVKCFSGGTEATAFNPRAVKAMQDVGFNISKVKEGDNPQYEVRFSSDAAQIISFSKKYDDPLNQSKDFGAIMTCSHADDNCPMVLGASKRIAITYDDPKDFDGTTQEAEKYAERVREIGREMLFVFSRIKV
ncbi:MAG TPA: protein-tyrosine-phosphatase [Cyclobacteriaceae bacterium]|jgi:arsenate reductase|nr:protein-tyrosine-phosphatase [Cyclobacteriaceae bacterium]